MVLEKQPPRERLIASACLLFYRHGFSGVGVNELIAHAGAHKASFYRHFDSLEDLAGIYLEREGERYRSLLAFVAARAADPSDFIRRWARLVARDARSGNFLGCPIARFMGSLDQQRAAALSPLASRILRGWVAVMAGVPERAGLPTAASDALATVWLRSFEADAALFAITRDTTHFDSMREQMFQAWRRAKSNLSET